MANALEGMLRGLSGGRGGLGKVNLMPKVGGFGGGGGMRGGGSTPSVSAPGASDPLRDPRSALSVGDEWLKGHLKEWFPTPQEKQARTNADLFSAALLGGENGQNGLLGQNITPELLAAAAGTMRQGGADAQGILDLVGYAVPAMQQQQQMEMQRQKMENEDKKLQAWLANINARTANTQAAGARAAAKAAGKGGGEGEPKVY